MQIEKRSVVMDDHSAGAVMEFDITAKELEHRDFYGVSVIDADLIMMDGKSLDARRTDSPYRN